MVRAPRDDGVPVPGECLRSSADFDDDRSLRSVALTMSARLLSMAPHSSFLLVNRAWHLRNCHCTITPLPNCKASHRLWSMASIRLVPARSRRFLRIFASYLISKWVTNWQDLSLIPWWHFRALICRKIVFNKWIQLEQRAAACPTWSNWIWAITILQNFPQRRYTTCRHWRTSTSNTISWVTYQAMRFLTFLAWICWIFLTITWLPSSCGLWMSRPVPISATIKSRRSRINNSSIHFWIHNRHRWSLWPITVQRSISPMPCTRCTINARKCSCGTSARILQMERRDRLSPGN